MRYSDIILCERREDIVAALSRYKDRDDVFVSFRSLPKLGINPQSGWDTPIGIYGYPLRAFWDAIEHNSIPFAGDAEYVIVFQTTGNCPDANPEAAHGYTEAMFIQDREKIRQKFLEQYRIAYSRLNVDHTWGRQSEYVDRALMILKNDPSPVAAFKNRAWAELMISRKMDLTNPKTIADAVDNGFLSRETVEQIAQLAQELNDGVVIDEAEARERLDHAIITWSLKAKMHSPAAQFWNVTRNLADFLASVRTRLNKGGGPIIWNAIMRQLGYDGFTDVTGTGLIHENEPTQGVFFSTKSLRVIEVLPNLRLAKRSPFNTDRYTFNNLSDLLSFLDTFQDSETLEVNRNFWLNNLPHQWYELRTTGKSRNFDLGETPQQFAQQIIERSGRFVRTMLGTSYTLIPVVLAEIKAEPQMQTKDIWNQVLAHIYSPPVKYLRLFLAPSIVALHAKIMNVSPSEARKLLSEKVVSSVAGSSDKIMNDSSPVEGIRKILAPMKKWLDPVVLTDDYLGKTIDDAWRRSIPF